MQAVATATKTKVSTKVGIAILIAFAILGIAAFAFPTGNLIGGGSTATVAICQKLSLTNISGTPCVCAERNIYSNGQLKNDISLTPKTYYCRQM